MTQYIGRFAPSPTGPLHLGSLVTALASYLDAMVHGGQWLLRMDDADLNRVQSGAADTIAAQLKHYGFTWQGAVSRTQLFRASHQHALQQLQSDGRLYACRCTRAVLVRDGDERIYNGACRQANVPCDETRSRRLIVGNAVIQFNDRWQGDQQQTLATAVGDFVVWRPENVVKRIGGLYSYQLTMPCDDAANGVTHVVRGADLLGCTARQLYVYYVLNLKRPSYLHVPLVRTSDGLKLSKQNHAAPLPSSNPIPLLAQAMTHLGCSPSHATTMQSFWRDAARSWEQRLQSLPASAL